MRLFLIVLLMIIVTVGWVNCVGAPRYLSIPDFHKCAKEESNGGSTSICWPKTPPKDCPSSTWNALQKLIKEVPAENFPCKK
uniref:Uncharacterized protein n=1 Tax=Acrobeloides nanus TaxID=290746 RepID=A0A914E765_9BILA